MASPLLSDLRRRRRTRSLSHRDLDETERPSKAIKTRQSTSVYLSSLPAAIANDAHRLPANPSFIAPNYKTLPLPRLPDQSALLSAPPSRPSSNRRHKHAVAAVTKAVAAPGSRPAATVSSSTRSNSSNVQARKRPPTRVTIAYPNGEPVQATNGVRRPIAIREGGLASEMAGNGSGQLQVPQLEAKKDKDKDKRSLRSQAGGSRLKSDLSIYFPNYDEVISGEQKEPDFLGIESPIYVSDEHVKGLKPPLPPSLSNASKHNSSIGSSIAGSSKSSATPSSNATNGFARFDFGSVSRLATRANEDTLPNDMYFKPHRRAERKEKQLRNIEKERAMHEKVQLERLLEGLQGHDWLRVMGVTGITDTEKKDYEPKRDYFILEVRTLVDKFRIWKEEEKRLRSEREEREKELAARQEADEGDDAEGDRETSATGTNEELQPDSDIDASAARQLLQEANIANKQPLRARAKAKFPKQLGKAKSTAQYGPNARPKSRGQDVSAPADENLNKPFTSFFSKPWERDAALNKHRHSDRRMMAFGQPLPDMEEKEFELPNELLDPDYLKQHERERRRRKRDMADLNANKKQRKG